MADEDSMRRQLGPGHYKADIPNILYIPILPLVQSANGVNKTRINMSSTGSQFHISILRNMSTNENATHHTIGKDLGISERMSQATSDTTKVGPKSVDLAINKEKFKDAIICDGCIARP